MTEKSNLLNSEFNLLNQNWEKLVLIGFCTLFSILFINLYTPFRIDQWEADQGLSQFIRLSGFGIIGGIVLSLSQFVLKPLLLRREPIVIYFIYWTLLEVLALALVFYGLYGSHGTYFFSEYFISLKYTFLGLLIPYTLALCFIFIFHKQNESQNSQETINNINKIISLKDEYGNHRLSLKSSDILFIEAADNYSIIYYKDSDAIKKEMLRNSLKALSEQLKDYPIKRCHRSFLVNVQNVKLAKKASGKVSLHLEGSASIVPVSRKFTPEFDHLLH
ncbi:LytTR family DNA-binding domain-containing protein [Cyclobacterium sp. 1_MG-2023]|uniref:LytR/AlgR family response regulator transcription factor n=1 Tax=Cyclobacterium sp. 1_MG-2023 TaxID=3062681 RepID=UPI0026E2FDA6|nr:LytTR family DNA-binding domain-containing protein [Cyclobacterium sp. 1_MG-2023]MDO6436623.1 LytTR family DNA-binding domain-containing protein [Cyclobacterium sp. 1_MG-2023]